MKHTDDFHCCFSGLLSTSMCHRAAGDNIKQPPKFVPPSKPVIIDKTQTVASMRKYDSLPSLILTDAIFKHKTKKKFIMSMFLFQKVPEPRIHPSQTESRPSKVFC